MRNAQKKMAPLHRAQLRPARSRKRHASSAPYGALSFVRSFALKLAVSVGTPKSSVNFQTNFLTYFFFFLICSFQLKTSFALRPCCAATNIQPVLLADKSCLEQSKAG
jgi:hypothetical protein